MWSWGIGTTGRLGLGNTTTYSSPVQIGSLTTWAMVATMYSSGMGLKTDGTLWAWGNGTSGQLGNGAYLSKSSPVQVGSLTTWLSVAGSYYTQFASKTDGTVWGVGSDAYGQIGGGGATANMTQIGSATIWAGMPYQPLNRDSLSLVSNGATT